MRLADYALVPLAVGGLLLLGSLTVEFRPSVLFVMALGVLLLGSGFMLLHARIVGQEVADRLRPHQEQWQSFDARGLGKP